MKLFTFPRLVLCVLCGALLLPGLGYAGWALLNPGTTNPLWSVHFPVDALTGFAVGGYPPTILKTTDGGANWISQTSVINTTLTAVNFPFNPTTGYAVGGQGAILKTTNGGVAWDSLTSGTTNPLYSVHFPQDAQTGYIVGYGGTILKSTNGGATWVFQSGTTEWLMSVHFPVDASTGYAVGGFPSSSTIIKTTNGGANWFSQPSGTTNYLFSVHFPVDALTGYAVGANGTILKTTDGGGVGVEEARNAEFGLHNAKQRITPNPFTSFATVPGHYSDRFNLYDISGRMVGTYFGNRIGVGLAAGVYFLRSSNNKDKPLGIVKVR